MSAASQHSPTIPPRTKSALKNLISARTGGWENLKFYKTGILQKSFQTMKIAVQCSPANSSAMANVV